MRTYNLEDLVFGGLVFNISDPDVCVGKDIIS